jgi:microsomal epoxide hydrolase
MEFEGKDSEVINKFSINVSNEVLEDLNRRLENTRFVEPISGTQFNYGFNSDYLKKVVDYWLTKYDWRKQELLLNKYNHYKTQISGINIHFIHVKPTKPAKHIIPIMVILVQKLILASKHVLVFAIGIFVVGYFR